MKQREILRREAERRGLIPKRLEPGTEAHAAAHDLRAFIRQAWHVVEPGTRYISGWHIDAIAEHLEAIERGEIRNLLINMPPRHMKSLTVSVFWPVKVWCTRPDVRWLFSSYAGSLSVRDSLKCRRLIQSPWYQQHYGHVFRLTGDQNAKLRFENDKTGYRLSTSVGGAATGEGGDIIVVDDPHNVQEAESDTVRAATLQWWDETMSTRLNDPKTGAKVIIMQRVHENDLSGHVLQQGGYEHLCLPAEYEPTMRVTGIGWQDPRTQEGDLLWPERVGPAEIADFKTRLGAYGYAGQMQQRPAPREGGMFQADWFPLVDAVPAEAKRVRYWDKAGTEGGGAYTAGVLMAKHDGVYYIEDVVRGQWSSDKRNRVMRATAEKDGTAVTVWVEQEPGSGGKESAELSVKDLAGFNVRIERVTGDKVTRAQPFSAQAEAGNVRMVRGEWNTDFVHEACNFPNGTYKDQIDAGGGALNKLALRRVLEVL